MPARRLPVARPAHLSDCASGPRPCPWISCRHHLADAHGTYLGRELRTSWPIDEADPLPGLEAMPETCVLDLARRGPSSLEGVGRYMNITRQAAEKIEERALYGRVKQQNNGTWRPILPGVVARGLPRSLRACATRREAERVLEAAIGRWWARRWGTEEAR